MADTTKSYNLVRSFYGWVQKVNKSLRRERIQLELPEHYQTTIPGAYQFSQKMLEKLSGTEHEERALYWKTTFESIVTEGWKDA